MSLPPPAPTGPGTGLPDWHAAATELVGGLLSLPAGDARLDLLETLCERLGPRLYPAFLHLLHTVERFGESDACACVAETLVEGLVSGRLPSGPLPAWGVADRGVDRPFGQERRLGPIEYVCAWYAQPSDQPPLARARFDEALLRVVRLIEADARAVELYARHLKSLARDPLGGSLAAGTRIALEAFAEAWRLRPAPESLPGVFAGSLPVGSMLSRIATRPPGI